MNEAGDALIAFLERAALDGHTVTPIAVAGAILTSRSLRLEDALHDVGPDGRDLVVAASSLVGLRRMVSAERAIATAVLARPSTLSVVSGPASAERDTLVASLGGARPAVLDDAERLDAETFAAFFASCADDETIVLAGDLDELGSVGPGQVFADIASSGLLTSPVVVPASSTLETFAASIRTGEFAVPDDPSRQVVVLPVASVSEAMIRVSQLLSTSIPRALGIAASDVQVLGVLEGDLAALSGVVSDAGSAPPLTIPDAVGRRYPGVIVVFSPASSGVLNRQLVYSAVRSAGRHLSIVNASGSALVDAVQTVPRGRRTLLPRLLAQLSSGSHSRSSSSESSSSDSSRPSTGPNGVTSSNPENSASS